MLMDLVSSCKMEVWDDSQVAMGRVFREASKGLFLLSGSYWLSNGLLSLFIFMEGHADV